MDFAIAGLVILAALLVRWPFVQAGETLLNPDEAIVGLMALDIAGGDRLPIYFYGQRYMGSLEAFIIAGLLPLFDNLVHALRFGPTCVFAVFAAMQYLMLTRWFGRRGGLAGVAVLLACSPMFLHWSISARGGYMEVMLWGAALLWTYSEWFVEPIATTDPRRRNRQRLMFGAIIGSGFWINPSIILFIAPIVLHALANRPLGALERDARFGRALSGVRSVFGVTTLPLAAVAVVLLMNMVSSVWVEEGRVRYSMLLGLGPSPLAFGILGLAAGAVGLFVVRCTSLIAQARAVVMDNAAMVLGILVGATPALLYLVAATLGMRPMDPSLPMGIRPLWTIGETLVYLLSGLPLLLGADPRPFVALMGMGHADVTKPLEPALANMLVAANWIVAGALVLTAVLLVGRCRSGLTRLLRLENYNQGPAVMLMMGCAVIIGLFVLSGCTMNFTTIRYMVPIWVFVPGLFAAVVVAKRYRVFGTAAIVLACGGYAVGQIGMSAQLGNPHPLHDLAQELQDRDITAGIAEPLDAHMMSFMTGRESRLTEFESFWVRLPHHRGLIDPAGPCCYIVETDPTDRTAAWTDIGFPGWPPPQTMRFLWPKLRRELANNPSLLLSREPLIPGFELFRLREPLSERTF